MAFDGFTVAAIVHELNSVLIEGRINKIAQPEKDELLLTIKASGNQYRLLLSANPSLPLCYLRIRLVHRWHRHSQCCLGSI